jgi:hypothetical protein
MDEWRGCCFETACGFMGVSVLRLVGYLPHPHNLVAVSVRMLQAADEHRILSMNGQVHFVTWHDKPDRSRMLLLYFGQIRSHTRSRT